MSNSLNLVGGSTTVLGVLLFLALTSSNIIAHALPPGIAAGDKCILQCNSTYSTLATCNADVNCVWDPLVSQCFTKCSAISNHELCASVGAGDGIAAGYTPLRLSKSALRCFWDGSGNTCRDRCQFLPMNRCSNDTFCEISNGLCVHRCSDVDSYTTSVLADLNVTAFVNFTSLMNWTTRPLSLKDRLYICDNVYVGHCFFEYSTGQCKPSCRAKHGTNEASCNADPLCRVDWNQRHLCVDRCNRNTAPEFCGDNRTKDCLWNDGARKCVEQCTNRPRNTTRAECEMDPDCTWHDQFAKLFPTQQNIACRTSCSFWNGNVSGCTAQYYCDYYDQAGVCTKHCSVYQDQTTCSAAINGTCTWDSNLGSCVRLCSSVQANDDGARCIQYASGNAGGCRGVANGGCRVQCNRQHFSPGVTSTSGCSADSGCALLNNVCYDSCSNLDNITCDASPYCSRLGSTCNTKCQHLGLTTSTTCTANANCQWIDNFGCTDKCGRFTDEFGCNTLQNYNCEWQSNVSMCTTRCSVLTGSACTGDCQLGAGTLCHPTCSRLNETTCSSSPYCVMLNHSYASIGYCAQSCRHKYGSTSAATCNADANCEFLSTSAGCDQKCSQFSNVNRTETCFRHRHCVWQAGACVAMCNVKYDSQSACSADTNCQWGNGRCVQKCSSITNITDCMRNGFCFTPTQTSCAVKCEYAYSAQSTCDGDSNCRWDGSVLGCMRKCSGVTDATMCARDPACFWSGTACKQNCNGMTDATSCNADTSCQWFNRLGSCQRKCLDLSKMDCLAAEPRCKFHGKSNTCQPNCGDMHISMSSCNADTACNWHNTTYNHIVNSSYSMTIMNLRCEARCSTLTNLQCSAESHCVWLTSARSCLPKNCSDRAVGGCDVGDSTCTLVRGECQANCRAAVTTYGVGVASDCTQLDGCLWNYWNETCSLSCGRKYGTSPSAGTNLDNCRADVECFHDPTSATMATVCNNNCVMYTGTACTANSWCTIDSTVGCVLTSQAHLNSNITACGLATNMQTDQTSGSCISECHPLSGGGAKLRNWCYAVGSSTTPQVCLFNEINKQCEVNCERMGYTNASACNADSLCTWYEFQTDPGCYQPCNKWSSDSWQCRQRKQCVWDWQSGSCMPRCGLGNFNKTSCDALGSRCQWAGYSHSIPYTNFRENCVGSCTFVPKSNCSNDPTQVYPQWCSWGSADGGKCFPYCQTKNTVNNFANNSAAWDACVADTDCFNYAPRTTAYACAGMRCTRYNETDCNSVNFGFCRWTSNGGRCLTHCENSANFNNIDVCLQLNDCIWMESATGGTGCHANCSYANETFCGNATYFTHCQWVKSLSKCVPACHLRFNSTYDTTGCLLAPAVQDQCIVDGSTCELLCHERNIASVCTASSNCAWENGKCYRKCTSRSDSNATICQPPAENPNYFCEFFNTSSTTTLCRDKCSRYQPGSACASRSNCVYTGQQSIATSSSSCTISCSYLFFNQCNTSSTCEWKWGACRDRCQYLDSTMCAARSHCIFDWMLSQCRDTCAYKHGSGNSSNCAADPQCLNVNPLCRERCIGQDPVMCQQLSHCLWTPALQRCENKCDTVHYNVSGTLHDPFQTTCLADAGCELDLLNTICRQKCNRFLNDSSTSTTQCTKNLYCYWSSRENLCKNTCLHKYLPYAADKKWLEFRSACGSDPECTLWNISTGTTTALQNFICLDRCTNFGAHCLTSWNRAAIFGTAFPQGWSSGDFCVPYDKENNCEMRCQLKHRNETACTLDPNCKWYIGQFCLERCNVFTALETCESSDSVRQCVWKRGRCEETCAARYYYTSGVDCRALDDTCDTGLGSTCDEECSTYNGDGLRCLKRGGARCSYENETGYCTKKCSNFNGNASSCRGTYDCEWNRDTTSCVPACKSYRNATACHSVYGASLQRCRWLNTTRTCARRCEQFMGQFWDPVGCDDEPHCKWYGSRTGTTNGQCYTRCEFFGDAWAQCLPSSSPAVGALAQIASGSNPYCTFLNSTNKCREQCNISHANDMTGCVADSDCEWFFGSQSCHRTCGSEETKDECFARPRRDCTWDHMNARCRRSCEQSWNNATGCNSDWYCMWNPTTSQCVENCTQRLGYSECRFSYGDTCTWVAASSEVIFHWFHPANRPLNETYYVERLAIVMNQPLNTFTVSSPFTACGKIALVARYKGSYDFAQQINELLYTKFDDSTRRYFYSMDFLDFAPGLPTPPAAGASALSWFVALILGLALAMV